MNATRAVARPSALCRIVLNQAESESRPPNRVAGEGTISDSVRSLALELAGPVWRARIRREAEALNASLFTRLMLREDVLPALRADDEPQAGGPPEALAQAEEWPESPDGAYEGVQGGGPQARPHGSGLSRGPPLGPGRVPHSPRRIDYFTLAAAEYRAGYPRESLASLQRFAEDYKIIPSK